ncbi:MAG: anti-sigma regulatory factor [Chloroflexota bacterium]|nr:MAG: ATP-binding protein [Chloroflexota bacterium]
MNDESIVIVAIRSDADIIAARQQGRQIAASLGFTSTEQALIATAISEVARNIVEYAQKGEITIQAFSERGKHGILVQARDQGPGIADLDLAMQDGYSTSNSLGLGLPGTKRLMDEFDITSEIGKGTTVTMKKWRY